MGYPGSDKAGGGTPGLLWRQRLEYAIGARTLQQKRDLLSSMHSNQRSMNPPEDDDKTAKNTIHELLEDNEKKLLESVEIFKFTVEALEWKEQKKYTILFDQILYQFDEISFRGKLYENIRPTSAPGLNQLG